VVTAVASEDEWWLTLAGAVRTVRRRVGPQEGANGRHLAVRVEVLLSRPAELAGMAPDRETVIEIVVAVAAVVLFSAGLIAVGMSSARNIDGLLLVGAIAGFVLVMAAIGTAFAYR
jgi:hypothetical protein